MTARGIRNHHPGNIDYHHRNARVGQLALGVGLAKPRFAHFDQPENGICALGKLLLNYRGKDGMPGVGGPGIDTPLEFINRWAPASENDTNAYAQAIAKRLGVGVRESIDISRPQILRELVVGIIVHENGGNPYPSALIDEGIRRALA
ncbi:structural protein P5 [Pseudomonas fulva]|uniref:structural protein P5 n=1 Tax=Pseudomonas fulva TaxID=47880 RepID=UPI000F7AEAC8|nr:structural protein P5 [Pseudomonas fulva]MBA1209391.1 structural protein P5 [Pseudomonas fulva]MBA1217779.1 structural protein P5 [Pseudomonas fulva]MDH0573259.1 structural protein P5 [Pseudomonas fulva]RRW56922.1 structural protein P5 [Pseudomonas fulva]